MINWLSQKEFNHKFETEYRPQGIYLADSLAADTSFIELNHVLPTSLSYSIDEDDGLGRRNVWFGDAANNLFMISCLLNNTTQIRFRQKQDTEKYQWLFLTNLIELPNQITKRITWIRSEFSTPPGFQGEAKSSIFLKSKHGITFEVYRAVSDLEAQELLRFLQNLNFEFEYWVDAPEAINQTWIIIKILPGEKDRIVGRYNERSMTEESARIMSLKDEAFYLTREEAIGLKGLTFLKGMIFNNAD